MKEILKELYIQEIDQSRLDFDHDPEYQAYYTQAEALWKGGDMPHSIHNLLDASNFLSFTHGVRLGMELAGWVRAGYRSAPKGPLAKGGCRRRRR